MSKQKNKILVNKAQAATICGLTKGELAGWVARGLAPQPVIQHGRITRFSREQVEAFATKLKGGAA